MKRGGSLIAGIAALGLWLAPSAVAKTFEVTRTADTAPNGCGQGGCTLREAVIAANNRDGADTIVLRSGKTYTLGIAGADEDDGATGDLDLAGPTTVRADGRRPATVDANDLDRAFDTMRRATFRGVRVIGGVTQMILGEEDGGAIRAGGGRLLLVRCRFAGIDAPPLGLGAANAAIQKREGAKGAIVARRTNVQGTEGVALDTHGNGDIRIERSRLIDNFYGAVRSFGAGGISVARSLISGGERGGITDFDAGAIRIVRSRVGGFAQGAVTDFDAGAITLSRSRVVGNGQQGVTDFGAGGIRLTGSRISGNDDAVQNFDPGGVVASRSRVTNNAGDGLGNFGSGGIEVLRSVVAGNDGGGVDDFGAGGVAVADSRVVQNGSQGVSDFGAGGARVVDSRVGPSGSQGVQDFGAGGVTVIRSVVRASGSQAVQNFDGGTLALRRARVDGSVLEAVAQFGEGALRISRTTVSGSDRTGVQVGSDALPSRIVDSTISGNRTASDGAGIENLGPLVIRNSTIAGNRADGSGGGIMNDGPAAELRLNNVTVARNLADADNSLTGSGGGLFNDALGSFEVGNSLIALNDQLGGDADSCAGAFASAGGNLRTDAVDCGGFGGPGDRVRANPRIGKLRRNGGPTATVALKAGSPAIGLARKASAEKRDQRGLKRDADPDSGAFER